MQTQHHYIIKYQNIFLTSEIVPLVTAAFHFLQVKTQPSTVTVQQAMFIATALLCTALHRHEHA